MHFSPPARSFSASRLIFPGPDERSGATVEEIQSATYAFFRGALV